MTAQYTYEYPRPMVTVDAVVFSEREGRREVLLVKRGKDPYAGLWALPGGFVEMEETLDAAVARELKEETGLTGVKLEQLRTFGDPGRDPRGRTIAVAYLGLVDAPMQVVRAADDAADAAWVALDNVPRLAFDHNLILEYAVKQLEEGRP